MATSNPKTGKATPTKKETPEEFVTKLNQSARDKQKINEGIAKLQRAAITEKLEASIAISKQLPQMHILLSKLLDEIKGTINFLKPGDSVVVTNKNVIEKKITDSFDKNSLKKVLKKVKVSLTKEEFEGLAGNSVISQDVFDNFLFGTNNP